MTLNYIYALIDPNTEEVRYVGKSTRPESRLQNHWKERHKSKTYKAHWLRSLNEVKPILKILEICEDNWEEREIFWIASFNNLTNHNKGGQGCPPGPQSPRPYQPQTPEHVAKRVEKLIGHEVSAETREKIGAPQRGRKLPDWHKEKLKKSPEQKAVLSAIHTGTKDSEKTKDKKKEKAQARSLRKHEENMRTGKNCLCRQCWITPYRKLHGLCN